MDLERLAIIMVSEVDEVLLKACRMIRKVEGFIAVCEVLFWGVEGFLRTCRGSYGF